MDSFQSIELKSFLDTLQQPKLLAATAITAGLGGIALLLQTQNTQVTNSSVSLTNLSEDQNTSNFLVLNSSSPLDSPDGTFSTRTLVLGVAATILIAASFFFCCKPENTTPEPIRLKKFRMASSEDPKFLRVLQIRALFNFFNEARWCENDRVEKRHEIIQHINNCIYKFRQFTFLNIKELSDEDFKVFEDNFIKLLASMFYEKGNEHTHFEMNETYFLCIKRWYGDYLEDQFKKTKYEGSTYKKIPQEIDGIKTRDGHLDSTITPDQTQFSAGLYQELQTKLEVLIKMIFGETLSIITLSRILNQEKYKDQYLRFKDIEKEGDQLLLEMESLTAKDFSGIEKRSLEFLSDLNCAKQFSLALCSKDEWRREDVPNVKRQYLENVALVNRNHFVSSAASSSSSSTYLNRLDDQKRQSEFYTLQQFFYEIYSKPIFFSFKDRQKLEFYKELCARFEDLKTKVYNYVYILNLSDEELDHLKNDLVKLHLCWNPDEGLFQETEPEEWKITTILERLEKLTTKNQNSFFSPKENAISLDTVGTAKLLSTNPAVAVKEHQIRQAKMETLNSMLNALKINWQVGKTREQLFENITKVLTKYESIQQKTILNFSKEEFEIWEENVIKLMSAVDYERNVDGQNDHDYDHFLMNEVSLEFIKRQYEGNLKMKSLPINDQTSHQEASLEEKTFKNDQIPTEESNQTLSPENINLEIVNFKIRILKDLYDNAARYFKAISQKTHHKLPILQYLIINKVNYDKIHTSSLKADKFPLIEEHLLNFIAAFNGAKQFYLNRSTTNLDEWANNDLEEWTKKELPNVKRLYEEIQKQKQSSQSFPSYILEDLLINTTEMKRRKAEVFAIRDILSNYYETTIFLTPNVPAQLELYRQQKALFEKINAEINDPTHIRKISNKEDFERLKQDLIKLVAGWDKDRVMFKQVVEQNDIRSSSDKLQNLIKDFTRQLCPNDNFSDVEPVEDSSLPSLAAPSQNNLLKA